MIEASDNDVGRRVRIEMFGKPSLVGVISAISPPTDAYDYPVVMVAFPDLGFPVATDCRNLSWADTDLL